MSQERVTRKDAERAFELLCELLNKRIATKYNDVGAWRLSYAGCYGGFTVEEIMNEHGGVNLPLGIRRRNARKFVEAVHFAFDVLRVVERDKEEPCNE